VRSEELVDVVRVDVRAASRNLAPLGLARVPSIALDQRDGDAKLARAAEVIDARDFHQLSTR
jgi:hypothetical protein